MINAGDAPNTRREQGRVISFDAAEGHGTIQSTAHGDELFVHFSFIDSAMTFRVLRPGQLVEFEREQQPGPLGTRWVARHVAVVAAVESRVSHDR